MTRLFRFSIWLIIHTFCLFLIYMWLNHIFYLQDLVVYGKEAHMLIGAKIDDLHEYCIINGLFLLGYNLTIIYNFMGLTK